MRALVALSVSAWPLCVVSAGDSIFQHIDPDAEISDLLSVFLESHRVKRHSIVTIDVKTLRETITNFEQSGREATCCVLYFQIFPDVDITLYTYRISAEWLKPWYWAGIDSVSGDESVIAALTINYGDAVSGSFNGLGSRIRIEPLDKRGTHIIWESDPFDQRID